MCHRQGGPGRGPAPADEPAVRRPAPPFGARRVREDGRPAGRRVPHQPFVMSDEGPPRLPVDLTRKRFWPDVIEPQPMHGPDRAATCVPDAMARRDGGPDLVGVAWRAVQRRLPGRGLPVPGSAFPHAPDTPRGPPRRGPSRGTPAAGRAPCRGRDGGTRGPDGRSCRHRVPRARSRAALPGGEDGTCPGHAVSLSFRPFSGMDGPFREACQPPRANSGLRV